MLKPLNKFSLFSIKTGLLGVSTLLFSTFISLEVPKANAVKLTNGKTAFEHPPSLIRSATSNGMRNNNYATYQFTLKVPENATETLKAVKIEQINTPRIIKFNQKKISAFFGDSFAGGEKLSLAAVGGNFQPGSVTVVFNKPVNPGETVTVSLEPRSNPSISGVYLFGITAYPVGENSNGIYVGTGRIHISN
ncbi:MAG: DUF2808 domain-containing protein [Rivularia sp. (in: Bacteria)]|nr:DUF2808 domain-containing protein [Rivularia sp. MS3]